MKEEDEEWMRSGNWFSLKMTLKSKNRQKSNTKIPEVIECVGT